MFLYLFQADGQWRPVTEDPSTRIFAGQTGVKSSLKGHPVREKLSDMFDDSFWQNLVDETNLYADQFLESATYVSPHSYIRNCKPVTTEEIKKFMALLVLMGITRKPSLREYWSKEKTKEFPIFGETMSRSRFMSILKFLHFRDNSAKPEGADRLYKVGTLLDYFRDKFQQGLSPNQHLSLDEAIIQFQGRLSFKTYNPMKPTKYGICVYALSDSKTGFC